MFHVIKRRIADVEPTLYKTPKSGETFTLGEALAEAEGVLSAAAATAMPDYICAGPKTAAGMLPVIPVLPTTVFATESSVAVAANLVGAKVTMTADALGVTATTTGGVFKVESTDGAAKSAVTGRFAG